MANVGIWSITRGRQGVGVGASFVVKYLVDEIGHVPNRLSTTAQNLCQLINYLVVVASCRLVGIYEQTK